MSDKNITVEDAEILKSSILKLSKELIHKGFKKEHIGISMAGYGLALVHICGGDIEETFEASKQACNDLGTKKTRLN